MAYMFGKEIRKARKKKGWTQEDLANALHVKRAVISKYENSMIEPSVARFKEIAQALDVEDWTQLATGNAIVSDLAEKLRKPSAAITDGEVHSEDAANEEELLRLFNLLNAGGKRVAVERMRELTEIPRYRR